MPDYRRAWHPGGTYFFTVNLLQRQGNDLLTRHIETLRDSVRRVRRLYPFHIHGWVVLPEHLHCVMELPSQDADFATRWRLMKMAFSKESPVPNACPRCAHAGESAAFGNAAIGNT